MLGAGFLQEPVHDCSMVPVNIIFYFLHVSFDSLVWPCYVTQVLHNALRQFNSTLGNTRMLFTTQNNGCIWKHTTDACSEFQASEMNPALHILSSLMFIYLFIFSLPSPLPSWNGWFLLWMRKPPLPHNLHLSDTCSVDGVYFWEVSPCSFPEMQEI